jgi:ribosomal protein S1
MAIQDREDAVELKALLADKTYLQIPSVGDVVKGAVISVANNEIRVDIDGYKTGIVRGRELFEESSEYGNLALTTEVEATVMELENENGEVELSFRYAGQLRAWSTLRELVESNEITQAKIIEANKGGLLVRVNHIIGFLPVVGIPLPLVSYGGSSLLTTMLALGILMNVRMRRFHPSMSRD